MYYKVVRSDTNEGLAWGLTYEEAVMIRDGWIEDGVPAYYAVDL